MAQFEEVGVEATVKGFALFMTQLNAMNTAIAASGGAGVAAAGGLGLMNVALLGVGVAAAGVVAAVAAVAAGFLVLGAAGLGIARSVESAFAGVAKTTSGLTDEFGRMNEAGEAVLQQFRELALVKPLPLEELLRIGELAGQLGIAEESLAGFASVAADLAVTTDLTIEEATLGLARFGSIFGITAENMVENTERLGSTIAFLGNNFATTEPQILNFAKRLAGIGKLFGFTQDEILGIGAAVTSAGVETQLGSTAIQNTMIAIGNAVASGSDELDFFAEIAGESADDFSEAWLRDAPEAFIAFIEGIAKQGQNFEAILDEVGLASDRTVRALAPLSATGDLTRRAIEGASTAFEENTALTREAEIRYATFDSQLQIFKNSLRDVGLEIGNIVLPFMRDLLEAAGPLIAAIGEGLVPAFQSVFDALTESLLPALGDLLVAFGFDFTGSELTQGIANFGETIAGGIEAFSDFVEDVAELVIILDEGGIRSLLEHFGIEEDTADNLIAVAGGITAFAISLALLPRIFTAISSTGAVLAVILGFISAPITLLALAIGVLAGLLIRFPEVWDTFLGLFDLGGIILKDSINKMAAVVVAAILVFIARTIKNFNRLLEIFGITEEIKERWRQIWKDVKAIAAEIWNEIVEGAKEWLSEQLRIINEKLEPIKEAIIDIWLGIKEAISEKAGEILFNIQQDLIRWIGEVEDAKDRWVEAGRELLLGLLQGLQENAQAITEFLTQLAEDALNSMLSFFGISSPSKIFENIGKGLMEGLALGITENMNLPQVALDAAGANIVNAGQGVVSGAAAMGASNVDRSFNVGGMTVNAREQAPNRIVDDLALLAQLSG